MDKREPNRESTNSQYLNLPPQIAKESDGRLHASEKPKSVLPLIDNSQTPSHYCISEICPVEKRNSNDRERYKFTLCWSSDTSEDQHSQFEDLTNSLKCATVRSTFSLSEFLLQISLFKIQIIIGVKEAFNKYFVYLGKDRAQNY